jgi:hypothetical protein
MVGVVKAHKVFLIVTHAPLTYAGDKCEHTTRSFNSRSTATVTRLETLQVPQGMSASLCWLVVRLLPCAIDVCPKLGLPWVHCLGTERHCCIAAAALLN